MDIDEQDLALIWRLELKFDTQDDTQCLSTDLPGAQEHARRKGFLGNIRVLWLASRMFSKLQALDVHFLWEGADLETVLNRVKTQSSIFVNSQFSKPIEWSLGYAGRPLTNVRLAGARLIRSWPREGGPAFGGRRGMW